ncbi:o-methyltransferase [Hirsutella rhossiliensis]|uniref:O-methyltransferase domain-containing protein n=1 Tax=Hirsutella rhossiliensis TaxID=111463 RepID=A0A9P8N1A2_9HYPO|nr:o-methyltransferase domain-containing protein [Hirsutella rhossiliensis]KAH0965087.1 o-methyltransferase domain-containing protein [Hirsutella rhossiliensis]
MESALAQIKHFASMADAGTRRQLMVSVHELAYSLEDVNDTVHRYGYLLLQTAAAKIGFDLGIFKYLAAADGPLTVEQVAARTGAETLLMSRYLRYLASIGAVRETAKAEYQANNVTKNLADRAAEAGVSHCFETIGPQYQALPSFLHKTSYRNPDDEMHTVFQDAWNTTRHGFAWFEDHPDNLRYFNDYMALRRGPDLSWLSVYPVGQEARDWDPQRPVYVNIGGGIGHQCAEFRGRYPDLPGRVVLQDLAHSIAKALPTPGVENTVHDFFEPQPVKGAKFYFSRGVLHNHPDHKVRRLLQNTKSAMASDSIMLLDEMVLPEVGVDAYAAAMDLTMLSAFASMERTEAQWRSLLEDVGLTLVKTYTYNPLGYETVMDVRLP